MYNGKQMCTCHSDTFVSCGPVLNWLKDEIAWERVISLPLSSLHFARSFSSPTLIFPILVPACTHLAIFHLVLAPPRLFCASLARSRFLFPPLFSPRAPRDTSEHLHMVAHESVARVYVSAVPTVIVSPGVFAHRARTDLVLVMACKGPCVSLLLPGQAAVAAGLTGQSLRHRNPLVCEGCIHVCPPCCISLTVPGCLFVCARARQTRAPASPVLLLPPRRRASVAVCVVVACEHVVPVAAMTRMDESA